MTTLERWRSFDRDVEFFRVNGCLVAEIHGNELRSVADWERLIARRVTGLIWLAMPGHETAPLGEKGQRS